MFHDLVADSADWKFKMRSFPVSENCLKLSIFQIILSVSVSLQMWPEEIVAKLHQVQEVRN